MERLQALHENFEGNILPAMFADGQHHCVNLIPRTPEDATRAIEMARLTGSRAFVRSGRHASPELFGPVDPNVENNMVIDMDNLHNVTVEVGLVKAGVGATAKNLAALLANNEVLLPVDAMLERSVVSTVLSNKPGHAPRSLGRPRDRVKYLHVVRPDGEVVRVTAGDRGAWDTVGPNYGIVTDVEFEPVHADQNSWVSRVSQPYSIETHEIAVSALFAEWERGMDLSVRVAMDGFFGLMALLIVTVVGRGDQSDDDKRKLLSRVVGELDPAAADAGAANYLRDEKHVSGTHDVMALFADDNVPGSTDCNEHDGDCIEYEGEVLRADAEDFVNQFCPFVRLVASECQVTADLQLLDGDQVRVSVQVFHSQAIVPDLNHMLLTMGLRRVPDMSSIVMEARAEPRIFGFRSLLARAPVPPVIPGFMGEVSPRGTKKYEHGAHAYASSSYAADLSSPFLVLWPTNASDVGAAIDYAKQHDPPKRIVAQSGGHQYSGKSTGPSDTIVLMMKAFAAAPVISPTNTTTLGVGLSLDIISQFLKNNKPPASIPHGECPKVCIGGHAQSGGFGHMIRSYGLALDYVLSFKAVLADGQYYTVVRPGSPLAHPARLAQALNDKLFAGVLGGGPGSFAVVTEYEFELIFDMDDANTWGASKPMFFEQKVFHQALREMIDWTTVGAPPGVDYFLSVTSEDYFLRKLGFMLIEVLYGDTHESGTPRDGQSFFGPMLQRIQDEKSRANILATPFIECALGDSAYEGPKPLSLTAHLGVRKLKKKNNYREFAEPYVKRVNGFYEPMSEAFATDFAQLVSDTIQDRRVKLVVQMLVGGGNLKNKAGTNGTGLPHRAISWGTVYDVFYTEGHRAVAVDYQLRMKEILERTMPTNQDNVRVFWGSYGTAAETNMSDARVVDQYYGDAALYSRLQDLKRYVDPTDLFHTPFTVQLP